jgi:hypothetical protein
VIKPTVGRVVWFFPYVGDTFARNGRQPLAAMVTAVWSDTCVNLAVFDANGVAHGKTSVLLVQPESESPGAGYCTWMPYQQQKAAAGNNNSESAEPRPLGGR